MKSGQRLWTRDELLLAINLYCKTPFGRLHQRNPEIIELAGLIGRTPGSVSFKLVNFASFDPSLQKRGIRGAKNASKLDRETWDEFMTDLETQSYESEKILADAKHTSVESLNRIVEKDLPVEGKTREQIVKVRVNQNFFRKMVLAAYNHSCCITGINTPELIIAGHIVPWSIDEKNRLNPCNGLLLNALHDRAFESGLISITPDYIIKISPQIKDDYKGHEYEDFFLRYDNRQIILPSRFLPDKQFLEYHYHERFKK